MANINILLAYVFVLKPSFRGQLPWRVRQRLVAQAINQSIELEANFICNVKFEQISFQWHAMYGTAVGQYAWKDENSQDEDTNHTEATTSGVQDLPDYSDYDNSDGSGSDGATPTHIPENESTSNTMQDYTTQNYLVVTTNTGDDDGENNGTTVFS